MYDFVDKNTRCNYDCPADTSDCIEDCHNCFYIYSDNCCCYGKYTKEGTGFSKVKFYNTALKYNLSIEDLENLLKELSIGFYFKD